jgi:L-alanine-DL-glutamate epimerase-like enolase superfamily enzyme
MITLRALETRRVRRALATRAGIGRHATDRRDAIELDLRTEADGVERTGRGEAAPLPGYSIDTLPQAALALERVATSLPWSLPLDGDLLEALGDRTADLPPSARAALEAAALDAAGQILARPLWSLLRTEPAVTVPLCALLDATLPALREQSLALFDAGYAEQKRKLGPGDADAAITALRAGLDARIALRLDANRSWRPEDFATHARQLAALRPRFVEEPIDGDLAAWLLDAPEPVLGDLRFAVDESLACATEAEALTTLRRFTPAITSGRVAAVVVKPARDGLLGAYGLGRAARRLGAAVVVTHLWDGPRAYLAAAHLAIALGSADAPGQGLAAHVGLGDANGDPGLAHLLSQIERGRLAVPTRPGLGACA